MVSQNSDEFLEKIGKMKRKFLDRYLIIVGKYYEWGNDEHNKSQDKSQDSKNQTTKSLPFARASIRYKNLNKE